MITKFLLIVSTYVIVHIHFHVLTAKAQIHDTWSDALADPMSIYAGGIDDQFDVDEFYNLEEGRSTDEVYRRSLHWKKMYYISYGALSANRVPCPPRSGRSYYTHDCFRATGPVHPYARGCSCITRCRR
ncbi:hypothetical protein RND81_06G033500 [Saponaria officinalis]|uniref:Protein RALF-like 34 n=1 Tax=Saponaria officinalis TaxID=3572 RepID=A0AAW1K6M0_SAPOF